MARGGQATQDGVNDRSDNRARAEMGWQFNITGSHDWFDNTSNFFAGWGDTLSMGWTDRARNVMGINDQVDKNSGSYKGGQWTGRIHGALLLGGCAPSNWARGAQLLLNGMRGASGMAGAYEAGRDAYAKGDWWGVAGAAGKGAWSLWQALQMQCFARGTPIRTPDGWKPIEHIQPGDLVLSINEHEEASPLEPQAVVGVKSSMARIWHVHLRDQIIRTSAGHPFFVKSKGWTAAGSLQIGDEIRELEGGWITVSDLCDAGVEETVYNIRVANYHTYFVGRPAWGFAVWVHNAVECQGDERMAANEAVENGDLREVTEGQLRGLDNQFGTPEFGNDRHLEFPGHVQGKFPDTVFEPNVFPGQKGPDLEWKDGPDPGFDIAELKPDSDGGRARLQEQLERWKSVWDRIRIFWYDENGDIHDGGNIQ